MKGAYAPFVVLGGLMKKNSSYFLTFFMGAIFGAFVIINFWEPNLKKPLSNSQDKDDIQIKRFEKNFDIKPGRRRARSKSDSLSLDMEKDIDDLQKQMQNAFKGSGNFFKLMEDSIEDATKDLMGAPVGEIVEKITSEAVILELDVTNIDNSSLNIEVVNDMVSISGEARVEERSNSGSRVMVSSFNRSYPVPEGTKASALRIESVGENKVQLIFPKENK
ncbi:MAG: HSP20 family molecular chaperone IbpA [Bacteriovoracaceae bacterium]